MDKYYLWKRIYVKGHVRQSVLQKLTLLCMIMLLWQSVAHAQVTFLGDLQQVKEPSRVVEITTVGNKVFFAAAVQDRTDGLYVTDGTEAGTVLLSDDIGEFTATGSNVYYTVVNQVPGEIAKSTLYITDGTVAGTSEITELPGEALDLTVAGTNLYFTIDDQVIGNEMWVSDGTEAGTKLLKDIAVEFVQGKNSAEPVSFIPVGNNLIFQATTTEFGNEVWFTDGTEAGTRLVKDIVPGTTGISGNPIDSYAILNGEAYFSINYDRVNEVWKTDGTEAGTIMIKDTEQIGNDTSPRGFYEFNGAVYFTIDRELWKTDGTVAGTVKIADSGNITLGSPIVELNGKFYYVDTFGGHELWASDGTAAGTAMFKAFESTGGAVTRLLGVLNNKIIFASNAPDADIDKGLELWESDGTAAGTIRVTDLYPGVRDGVAGLTAGIIGNQLLFYGNDGTGETLFITDGTAANTAKVLTIIQDGVTGLRDLNNQIPGNFLNVGSETYFTVSNVVGEIWKTDGTVAGTMKVAETEDEAEIKVGYLNSPPGGANNTLRIRAAGAIWHLDENFSNPVKLNIGGSSLAGSTLESAPAVTINNKLVMGAGNNPEIGEELYTLSDNPNFVELIKDIQPGGFSSFPRDFLQLPNKVVFSANKGTGVRTLWASDGTEAGTIELSPQIITGPGISLGATAIIPSFTGIVRTDGTLDGTETVLTHLASDFFRAGDALFFTVESGNNRGFWITDLNNLNAANTFKISTSTTVSNVLAYNGKYLYVDTNGFYETDGTEGNSLLLLNRDVTGMIEFQGQVYLLIPGVNFFSIYNGDPATIVDITLEGEFTNFRTPHVLGNTLLFRATTQTEGEELYAYTPPPTPAISLREQYTSSSNVFVRNSIQNGFKAEDAEIGPLRIGRQIEYQGEYIADEEFVISNSGQAALTFTSEPTFTGPFADSFEFVDFPESVAAGSTGTFKVKYISNLTQGEQVAQINIATNDPNTPLYTFEVKITTNLADPEIDLIYLSDFANPVTGTLEYGRVEVGQEVVDTIFIANGGRSPLVINEVRFEGDAANDFQLKGYIGSESQTVLNYRSPLRTIEEGVDLLDNDPNYRLGIIFAYSPTTSGLREATIVLESNRPIEQELADFRFRRFLQGRGTCKDIGDITPDGPVTICTNLEESVTLSIPPIAGAEYCWGNTAWQELDRLNGAFFGGEMIFTDPNLALIAALDRDGNASVFKYENDEFTQLGATGFSELSVGRSPLGLGSLYDIDGTSNGDVLYAYADASNSDKLTIKRFDGTDWSVIGTAGLSTGKATEVSLATDGTTIYAAFSDEGNVGRAQVLTFDGTDWVAVGTTTVASALSLDLEVNNGLPYLAFRDGSQPNGGATVLKFENNAWTAVGERGFSEGEVSQVSLEFDDNDVPYVAYRDPGVTLQRFDGTNWIETGNNATLAPTLNTELRFAINGETPYVGFTNSQTNLPSYFGLLSDLWLEFESAIAGLPFIAADGAGVLHNLNYSFVEQAFVLEQLVTDDCLSTTNTLEVTEAGFYQVQVTLADQGCITTSNNIVEVIATNCQPDILVQGNNENIITGSTDISFDNATQFPKILPDQTEITTYNIINTGLADLTLTLPLTLTGDNVDGLGISEQPASATVAPEDTVSFQVSYSPTAFTTSLATVNITNNVAEKSPYTFNVSGEPSSFSLDMVDAIITDINEDGKAGPGDVMRYTVQIDKAAGTPLSPSFKLYGFDFNLVSLVSGSVTTTKGVVADGGGNSEGDLIVFLELGDFAAEETATITFDVMVIQELPDSEEVIKNQVGLYNGSFGLERYSDDPDIGGNIDFTETAIGRSILLASATKESETQITLSFNLPAITNEGNPTDFTVTDGLGTDFPVSAQADGTAGDNDIVLTVSDLSMTVGDLTITYTNNNGEIQDENSNPLETDATGVTIDTDMTAPTLVSGSKVSETLINLVFSEEVQITTNQPTDFTVVDADNNNYAVSELSDGVVSADDQLALVVADISNARGPLTVTYIQNSLIEDFGGNALQTDNTGIDIGLAPAVSSVDVPGNDTYGIGNKLDFTVNFSDPITITGAPTLTITIGETQVEATLNAAVNAATTAFFSYRVQAGEEDIDGIALTSELTLNGATIQDAENVDALTQLNGIGATTAVLVDAIAPAAPVFASISDDNGSSNSDQITNDQSLFVRGTAEPNSRLSLSIDGQELFGGGLTILVDGDGNWEFNPIGEGEFTVEEGQHTYIATVEDAGGNESPVSAGFVVTVDLTAPAAPVVTGFSTDTGDSDTDNLTNDQTLMFTGTAEANGTVEVFIDASSIGTTSVDENGDWTYDHTATSLAEGTIAVTAKATDVAGNQGVASQAFDLEIDITAQAVPVVTGITTDTGASATDNITNDQTLAFTGTAEANITVEVFMDASSIGTTTADANGNWVYDHTGTTLAEATYSLTAKSIDAAGNTSAASAALSVEVDITPPNAGAVFVVINETPELIGEITNENRLVFSAISIDDDGFADFNDRALYENDTYELFINGESQGSTTALVTDGATIDESSVSWNFDFTDEVIADGTYELTIVATDLAGNTTNGLEGYERPLIIDTQIPGAPVISGITSDTGSSDTDNLTNDQTLMFTGTAEANGTVEVFIDASSIGTTTVDENGDWTYDHTATTLSEGIISITAKAADLAGNQGPLSDGTSVTIDITAQAVPTITGISTDTGVSDTDNITNSQNQMFSGTAEANITVEVFIDDASIGTTTADANGDWTFDHTGTTLAEATYSLTAKSIDAAGNASAASAALSVEVDITAPFSGGVAQVQDDTDEGFDLITEDNTLIFVGVAVDGDGIAKGEDLALFENDTYEFFIDGTSIGSVTGSYVKEDPFAVWFLDYTNVVLADGSYQLSVVTTDLAGNTSPSVAEVERTLIVDTQAPPTPTVDLVAASDLGISNTDNLTSEISPTVEGTTERNATVTVFVDDSQVGTTTADNSGNWSFTIMTDWGDGTYAITAKAKDVAGNESSVSEGLNLTLDNALDINDLEPADDETDVLPNTDFIITFDKNVVKGTGNIQIIQSSNDEVQQTIDVMSDLVFIDAETVIIDPAANILPPDTEFYVNIDAGAFQNEAGADFEGISDKTTYSFRIIAASVVSSVNVPSDDIYKVGDELDFTVNMVLPVTVTGTPTIPVTIGDQTVNATLVGTATNTSTLIFRYTVIEGDLDIDGIAVGTAMNLNGGTMRDEFDVDAILSLNSVGSTTNVLIDGVIPDAPVILSITDDTGSSDSDNITNDPTLIVRGTAEANSRLSLLADREDIFGGIIITVDGDGNWEFNPVGEGTFTLEEGVHTYTATTEDAAGNVSAVSENFVVTVDLTAPAQPTIDLSASADLGISNTDNLTSGGFIELNGTAEPNSIVIIRALDENGAPQEAENEGDDEEARAVADESGNWVFSQVFPVPSSVLELVAVSTDAAGNTSVLSETLTIVYDQETALVSTSPAHQEEDVLPNTNLTLTFDENVVKGTGNITIIQSDNDEVQQTIDVTGDNVTVDGATVTINPPANILPPDTEFYVNIDEGAFENEAGAGYAGISDNTTFSFTIIAASVVTSVEVPADDTYIIGENLDFTVNMVLPITISGGTATIPVTIGDNVVNATQVGTVSNSSTILFRYTVLEGNLDTDGIAVGAAINLNGGTMQDEFDVDAILTLNSIASTTAVLVDGIKPDAPVVESITEDTGSSGTDGITNDADFVVNGTAEANATVQLSIAFSDAGGTGSSTSGPIQVDDAGNWSFGFGFAFEDRVYAVTATTTDVAGNEGAESDVFDLIIDTTPPAAPTLDLAASSDQGISNSDNLTSSETFTFQGTAEPGSFVTLGVIGGGGVSEPVMTDDSGNWTFIVPEALPSGDYPLVAIATDLAGNESAVSETLNLVVDNDLEISATSPTDNEIDVLPNADLTVTFDKNVVKGTGNITIIQSSNDQVLQIIDVTGSNVTISGAIVTIDPAENILPPDTEFYVNIDAGAFENEAGAAYVGLSDKTSFSFTIIAASVVTSVDVPVDGTYMIGDQLDFTANMVLPVSIAGTATIPVTIGDQIVNATQVGTVSNASSITFRYTIVEDDLDDDGITVGAAINLNGGTMRDEFDVDAILTLNNVGATTAVLVDAVKPTPVINTEAVALVNGTFSATITYNEAVENVTLDDLTVVNGTATNLMNPVAGTTWTVDITPSADGTVTTSLAAATANDVAGNSSNASNSISREFDGTPPVVVSLNRTSSDPVNTGVTTLGYRVVFSEDVTGVDVSDFDVITTGTAAGNINSVTPVDPTTYDITIDGVGGEGTLGLNAMDDNSILDLATNPLDGVFSGQVYAINFVPTDITLSVMTIDENNELTAIVASLTTTDADAGDGHTYTLVAGTGDADNGSFAVDGTNLRANNLSFNFEDRDSYSFRLRTDDSKGGIYEEVFTITVNDVNEVPSMLSLSNNSIDEDDEAQDVGMLVALDQDGGETFTYTLVTGTGDADNAEFEINGNTLRTAGLINFEDGTTRSILLRVTDSGGLTLDQQFTINIGEVVIEPLREFTNIPGGAVRNIFSPNGDGVNDTWVIEDLLDNPVNTVKVYAQGGKLIFSQDNYRNDWDGTFEGDPIPDGTYYYEINVYDGQSIIRGFLTIIRNR